MDNNFQWTDELVEEFHRTRNSYPFATLRNQLESFKQSKSQRWVVFTGNGALCTWEPVEYKVCIEAGENAKIFNTRDEAEQYIFENKPCLSLKEVMDIYYNVNGQKSNLPMPALLVNLAQSKL